MKEILLTSSVLILALLALRRLFRETLSRRAQYALWGLVLLRLLVPVSLPAAGFSLLTAAEPVVSGVEDRSLYVGPYSVTLTAPEGEALPSYSYKDDPRMVLGPPSEDGLYTFTDHDQVVHEVEYSWQIGLEDLLRAVWYGGMVVMACRLVLSNLLFWQTLRKTRVPYPAEGPARRIYVVEDGLASPCLFGLFRPAVYLTPAALASPDRLRHVLAHEETHARHRDPLWALLRGICLVVYWFDPLVWWAALASRTDCELACDEGALRRLGEAERIPYGRTLLSLIPVRRIPADPLLSATTMTADKRRLTDRIARIAEDRGSLGTALFAAVSLAALVCAVTFTGAKTAPEPPRPLTQEELDYFNGAFFTEDCGRGENRRRQFLTSVYADPRAIDLYELLYNGTGLPETISEGERRDLDGYCDPSGTLDLTYVKLSLANIDAFLLENTGLSLHDISQDHLDRFWWMLDYDAYYNSFSDGPAASSYDLRRHPAPVTFTSGTREGGTVELFYEAELFSSGRLPMAGDARMATQTIARGPLRLTLRETPDGGWQFVSNEWDRTDRAPAAPDWAPIYTIPLDDLEPYEPEAAEPVPFAHGYLEMLDGVEGAEDPSHILGDHALLFFRDGEGRVFAGVQHAARSSWPPAFWSFHPGESGSWYVSWFQDLMGHDGFCITYTRLRPAYTRCSDYYYLDGEGQPVLLARVEGYPDLIDLDGDGQKELVSQSFYAGDLYFARDGEHYRAELDALLAPYWPGDTIFSYENWDPAGRTIPFRAWTYSHLSSSELSRREYRTLYFDGGSLLVYNDQRHFEDHMTERPDEHAEVIQAALAAVERGFDAAGAPYDDWRITGLDRTQDVELEGQTYRIWRASCEFHTPQPRDMPGTAAQDCWADPFYPGYLYLIFRDDSPDESHSALTYLTSMRQYLRPSAQQLPERLAQAGAMPDAAAVQIRLALEQILESGRVNMTELSSEGARRYDADPGPSGGAALAERLLEGCDLSYAEDPGDMPAASLLMMDQGGSMSLRFWPDSDLVLLSARSDAQPEETWFSVRPSGGGPSLYDLVYAWYEAAA